MTRRVGLWLALTLAGNACLASDAAPSDPELARLIEALDQIRDRHNVSAFALSLVSAEALLWSGVRGLADRANRRPATAETLFRIGSITKAFTALALLIAEREEALRLDDPLRVHVPDAPLKNPWASTHPVRLIHLLEHTAGLLDITKAEFDHNVPLTLKQALAVEPDARVSRWRPGLHSSYSNAGAGLAAYALEQATGESYEAFVKRRLFGPLGMASAGLELNADAAAGLAKGYDADGETVIPYWHMVFPPFGAINATAADMAAFVQLFLNGGMVDGRPVVSAALIERMESPRTTLAAGSGLRYGYGLGNYGFIHDGFLFHGHGGDADGFLAHFAYNRDSNLGYFVVINAFNGDALAEMRRRIQDYMVRGLTPPQPPPAAPIGAGRLARLTGEFQPVTWRFPWTGADGLRRECLTVTVRDGRLYTKQEAAREQELIAVTSRHFRRPEEPVATVAFVDHDGELYLQGDLGNYRRAEPGRSQCNHLD